MKTMAMDYPLYIQIAETFANRIMSGDLKPGDRLPPERDLCQMLNVSRMTLRQALNELELRGLLSRRQGDGTYIAEPKIERNATKLVAFTDALRQKGYHPSAKILLFDQRLADERISNDLHIPLAGSVFYYQRLRLVNQEPLMLEKCFLPVSRFKGLEKFDLENRSVYEILRNEYGVRIDHSHQSLEAVLADEYEAGLLSVQPGAAMMLQHRLAYDVEGNPIECGDDIYRGDRFTFVTDSAPFSMEE